MNRWEKQKREISSYNIFNSSVKRRHDSEGLHNFGYKIVGDFLHLHDGRNEVVVEPDVLLYNGQNVLFVEIKSGENINSSDIEQMQKYTELGREAVENFLKDTQITQQGLQPREFDTIDHCIVFYKDFIRKCRTKWDSCRERLEELKEVSPVLTQKRGSKLTLNGGSVNDPDLESILNRGVDIPKATDTVIYLPENVEPESLSYSIANDIVINNLQNDKYTLTASDVRNFYGRREIPLSKVNQSFQFLKKIGACRAQSDGSYLFHRRNISEIMAVEEKLRRKPVKEYLDDGDEAQAGLGDFS